MEWKIDAAVAITGLWCFCCHDLLFSSKFELIKGKWQFSEWYWWVMRKLSFMGHTHLKSRKGDVDGSTNKQKHQARKLRFKPNRVCT
jgi:hypothetical protein